MGNIDEPEISFDLYGLVGNLGIKDCGAYSTVNSYWALDMVSYQGTLYIAKSNNSGGILPSNTNTWMKFYPCPVLAVSGTVANNDSAVSGAAVVSFLGSKIAAAI